MKADAKDRAFRLAVLKPYMRDWPPDTWCRCTLCGQTYHVNFIATCHIKSVGAHPELRYEKVNAFAGCSGIHTAGCHEYYDGLPEANQEEWIRRKLPDGAERLEALAELINIKAIRK